MLEKLFERRLVKFMDVCEILNEHQYGFRKNRSTDLALLQLVEEITTAMDRGLYTVGVFVDLKKAFDTLDYSILLSKLDHIGVRGTTKKWLSSYLSNRQQFVEVNGTCSSYNIVSRGVPQGSIIGPIMFLIYINDIIHVSNIMKFVLFADDTNLFKSGDSVEQLCLEVSKELDKLNVWFNLNKLSLNLSKTQFMVFSNRLVQNGTTLYINGNVIERVHCTRFLGVELDDKLKWSTHVSKISKKVSRSLSIMFKVRPYVTNAALYTIYSSLVLPYFLYAIIVWGNAYKSTLQRLTILQKRCIRVINGSCKYAHTSCLFYNLRVLKLSDLVKYMCLIHMYKAFYGKLPTVVQGFFDVRGIVNTRQANCFKTKYARTTLKCQTLSIVGPKLWNALPTVLKSYSSVSLFKTKLKNFYINNYQTAS